MTPLDISGIQRRNSFYKEDAKAHVRNNDYAIGNDLKFKKENDVSICINALIFLTGNNNRT